MAIGFGIASRNWWRAQIKGGVSPSFSLDFANIANDFTFTRNSFATRVNELGLIETVTDLGNELVVNGDFATDSDWSKFNATISGGKGNLDGDGQTSLFWQSILTNGKTYKATFTISDYNELGEARLMNNNGTTIYTITSNGTFTINFTHNIADGNFLFRARTGAIFSIDNVSVKEVLEDDVPRIDYTNGEAAFLLEPQSTNLIEYSEDFSDVSFLNYGETNATLDNAEVNPYGELGSYKITSTSGLGRFGISVLVTPSTDYTVSFYAKNIDASVVKLLLTNVTSTSVLNYTSSINSNGWSRVEFSFTTDIGAVTTIQLVRDLPVGESLYLWGVQVEALPYATSYIPTNGTTVTRAAETCVDATPTINSEEGVLYAEISALADDLTNRMIALSDSDSSDHVRIYYTTYTNKISVAVKSNDSNQYVFLNYSVADITDYIKIAVKYKSNDFATFINGVKVNSQTTTASTPIGLDRLTFNSGAGATPFYGNTKDLKIYDKALTDDELITLTTI